MDIVYGIDSARKRLKRRAMTEAYNNPGILLKDLVERLELLFRRTDAQELVLELCQDMSCLYLSAESGLYVASDWKPQPGDEIDP